MSSSSSSSQPNGKAQDHANDNAPARSTQLLSRENALTYLNEYPRGDGLSLAELMDSRKNGGLTYNDFLMLPGHINFPVSQASQPMKIDIRAESFVRLPTFLSRPSEF